MSIIEDNKRQLNRFKNNPPHPSYIAGFIDGDGCIFIRKILDGYQSGFSITQCRTNILQIIRYHFGGSITTTKTRNKSEDVIINNNDQTQLGPLTLDESMDTQTIDKSNYDKQLLAITIAGELSQLGVIRSKNPDILKLEQELNYKPQPNRKFLVNKDNMNLVMYGLKNLTEKHNQWIFKLTSQFSSSPTND